MIKMWDRIIEIRRKQVIGLQRAARANETKMLRYQGKYNCIIQDHKVEASVKDYLFCIDVQDDVDEIDY